MFIGIQIGRKMLSSVIHQALLQITIYWGLRCNGQAGKMSELIFKEHRFCNYDCLYHAGWLLRFEETYHSHALIRVMSTYTFCSMFVNENELNCESFLISEYFNLIMNESV